MIKKRKRRANFNKVAIKKIHADQSGVTLTELLVAMVIFSIVLAATGQSLISFMKTTAQDRIRAQSSSAIIVAGQRIDSYMRYASAMKCGIGSEDNCKTIYMYVPPSANDSENIITQNGKGKCVRLKVDKFESSGSEDREGVLQLAVADSVNDGDDKTSDPKPYGNEFNILTKMKNFGSKTSSVLPEKPILSVVSDADGNQVNLRFTPTVGEHKFSMDITSDADISYTVRNYNANAQSKINSYCDTTN